MCKIQSPNLSPSSLPLGNHKFNADENKITYSKSFVSI